MANYREEQLRNNRRLARQVLGGTALALAVIGLFTVIGWCIAGLRTLLDDTERKQQFADRLYGLVILDPLPFDDVNSVDSGVFKQAAIWGTVYQIQKNGGSLDQYERDPDTGSTMIPQLEIDSYIANLLGPDYAFPTGEFYTDVFNYEYNAEKQCYLVPVTGQVALYTPVVEKIRVQGGKTYVTVGYVPTLSNTTGELALTAPTEPTKYMDYVFERGAKRQWYLSALQESDTKPAATPTPSPTAPVQDTQVLLENQLNSSMTDAAGQQENEPLPDEGAPAPQDAADQPETTDEAPQDAAPAE